MHKSKLIGTLQTLTYKELKRFEQYVASPFFNSSERALKLLMLLRKHHPDFDSSALKKQTVFNKLFGAGPYNDKKMRYAISDLYQLLEDYLIYLEFDKQEARKKHLLLLSLDRRNLDQAFLSSLDAARQMMEKRPFKDLSYWYSQILLEEDLHAFTEARQSRTVDHNIQTLLDRIDIHYLYRKLKYSCAILNLKNIVAVEYDLSFLEATVAYLRNNPPETVAIRIYLQILLTLQESDDEGHYAALKSLLLNHLADFSKDELKDMFAFAQNYCIKKVNMGDDHYLEELFDLYRVQLDELIIIDNNTISQFDFKNVSTVALRLGKYDWVHEFTDKFQHFLRKEFRTYSAQYNLARIYFYQGEHRKALRHLLQVEAGDVYYQLGSKSLLLKIYYELNEYEPLLSLTTSFKTYLRRNKSISEYQRTTYINLINFVKKLSRVKLGAKVPIEAVRLEMDEVKQIADLTWLKSKVEELA